MAPLLIAIQFLTILPIKIKSGIKEADFGKSLIYFPVAGLGIGLLLFLAVFILNPLPVLLKAAIILIISIVITGGIHLDGFADTCDGFYGNKPKEKILEIMRDSRIGTMGAVGIFSIFLLKFVFLVSISPVFLWKALLLMSVFSRWSQTLACVSSKYARNEGKAKFFIEFAKKRDVILGGIFTLVLFILLAKLKGLLIFISSLLVVLLFIKYIKNKIGGMTGDTIGATNEIAEVVILLLTYVC